jgi:HK97 family phage prohead protease
MLTKHFEFELKTLEDSGTFEGLASTYGNIDLGGDVVEPGAFTKSLSQKSSVPILYQHNQKQPIGLGYLEDSESGLKIRGELVLDVPEAKSAYALMKKGVLRGLSIGYRPVREVFDASIKANRLQEIALHEVSVVTFPMNEQATIGAVKAATIRDFEAQLRDVLGYSQREAKALASGGFKALQRDAATDTNDSKATEAAQIAALLAARTTNLRRLFTPWN